MKLHRVFIAIAILLLVGGIAFFVFSIHSRMSVMEYQFQVDAILSAATVANNGELKEETDQAVIAEYDGHRAVVHPGNYRALSSYLRKDAAAPLTVRINESAALKLTVCDEAVLFAVPEDDKGDVVLIRLETSGKRFQIRTDGGNLWESLKTCCLKGTYHHDNLQLP